MLFMLKVDLSKPAGMSNKEFYTIWRQEAEAALGAVKAGLMKGIWKVAARPEVIGLIDAPSVDDLDRALHQLPIWRLGYSHIVSNLEVQAVRPYENWAEDLKELCKG